MFYIQLYDNDILQMHHPSHLSENINNDMTTQHKGGFSVIHLSYFIHIHSIQLWNETSFDLPVKFFSCIQTIICQKSQEWFFLELCKKLYEVGGSRSISGHPPSPPPSIPPQSKFIPNQDSPPFPLITDILLAPSWCKGRLRWLRKIDMA